MNNMKINGKIKGRKDTLKGSVQKWLIVHLYTRSVLWSFTAVIVGHLISKRLCEMFSLFLISCIDKHTETTILGQRCRSTQKHYSDSESLSLLLIFRNVVYSAEKQQIPIVSSLVWPYRGSNSRSTGMRAITLTTTPSMWFQVHTVCNHIQEILLIVCYQID